MLTNNSLTVGLHATSLFFKCALCIRELNFSLGKEESKIFVQKSVPKLSWGTSVSVESLLSEKGRTYGRWKLMPYMARHGKLNDLAPLTGGPEHRSAPAPFLNSLRLISSITEYHIQAPSYHGECWIVVTRKSNYTIL